MITAQVESLTQTLDEMKPLFPTHWEDLALNKDAVPLDPDYSVYLRRDAVGEVLLVTLRETGRLIGYFVGFIAPSLHYKTCLTGTMDIYYILPEKRGGTKALRLFRCVLNEMNRRGVRRVFMGSKLHKDTGRLFEALDMQPVETYYSRMLEGYKRW